MIRSKADPSIERSPPARRSGRSLVRRAVVHGDPNALPSDDLVADTAISAALTFLNSPYGARSQVSP